MMDRGAEASAVSAGPIVVPRCPCHPVRERVFAWHRFVCAEDLFFATSFWFARILTGARILPTAVFESIGSWPGPILPTRDLVSDARCHAL